MDFCKKNGISVEDKSCHSFDFSQEKTAYFYFFVNKFSSEFCQVSVASDGYVRFHKNGDSWIPSFDNTDLNLFDKKDVAKLKEMLGELKKKAKKFKNRDKDDSGYSSDESY